MINERMLPLDETAASNRDKEAIITAQQSTKSTIEQYYDSDAQIEWNRLERHRMEFAVTMRTLTSYLPPAPQSLLDVGGGPGRYALSLASLGYQVTLLDLSQSNLDFAEQKAQESNQIIQKYIHGNALNLSNLRLGTFDAVLLLGPLYHLLTSQEREQAVREAWQVLRPGGLFFASFITRYAAFRDLAKTAPLIFVHMRDTWEEILRTGVYHGGQGVGFTDAYFAHPAEIKPLMERVGFETLNLVGCQGIIAANEELVNELTGEALQAWVDVNYRLGQEPSLHGAADHLLYVGRKPIA